MSGDRGRGVGREVVNPDHTELVELLAAVQGYRRLNAGLLDLPARVMGAGGAWTGPHAADVFADDLQARRLDVAARFEELVGKVRRELARVPATVTRVG